MRGSTLNFALQVLSHSANKEMLFKPVIPFTATLDGDTLDVHCEAAGTVRIARAVAGDEPGRRPAAFLLNKAVTSAVTEVLAKADKQSRTVYVLPAPKGQRAFSFYASLGNY